MHRVLVALLFGLVLLATASAFAQDTDMDGIDDLYDNCVAVPNPSQSNWDYDRFGNACDGDVDQDGDADSADRALIEAETLDPDPEDRLVADFDEDGDVDADDLALFDSALAGPGPQPGDAGAQAHDLDADGILDFCASDPDVSFKGKWDPVANPDMLPNGALTGSGPTPPGWAPPVVNNTVFQTDVRRTGDGAFQWLAWGGGGTSGGCGKGCIQPLGSGPGNRIPVDPDRTYAYSWYHCTPDFPPTTTWLLMEEFDANGVNISEGPLQNGKRGMNATAGRWEESIFFYTPSSPDVESVAPRIFRDKKGPMERKGTLFFDDFAFWELDEEANHTYRSPPATKRAFAGTLTQVDARGNASVFRDGVWEDFFPIGIYAAPGNQSTIDFVDRYSDAGFTVAMNEQARFGNAPIAKQAVDAVSVNNPTFSPDGMSFMFFSHLYHKGQPDLDELELRLAALENAVSPGGIPVLERLFAYNYDNEIFNGCGLPDPLDNKICLDESMWKYQEAPLARIFEWDRSLSPPPFENQRSVPSYFLNGNSGVARAYTADPGAQVGAWNDFRTDVTSSYGAAQIDHLERLQGQEAPVIWVQVQTSVFDRYRSIAMGGIALGAHGFGTWRDWDCDAQLGANVPCGAPYKAPTLVLCGDTDFGLPERGTWYTAPGATWTTVEGVNSGAEAEILALTGDSSCGAADAAVYKVHLRAGEFEAGETVRHLGGAVIPGATVRETPKPGIVDYQVSIVERDWWQDLPQLRRELDAMAVKLRLAHGTFEPGCRATLPSSEVVPFGSNGIICGTRGGTPGEGNFIILSNTWTETDPYADWGEQYSGETLTVEITPTGFGNTPNELRPFDPQTLQFTTNGSLYSSTGTFTTTLPPLGTRVYQVYFPSGCGLLGIEPLLVLGALRGLRRWRARRNGGRSGR